MRICRITPSFVDLFVVRTPGTRRASVLMHILASFLGNDGHLNHHGSLVVELVHKLLPVLLFLQCGFKSQSAALPDDDDGQESAPQRRPAHATPHAQPKAQHTD